MTLKRTLIAPSVRMECNIVHRLCVHTCRPLEPYERVGGVGGAHSEPEARGHLTSCLIFFVFRMPFLFAQVAAIKCFERPVDDCGADDFTGG